jgi:hypothetical protein
MREYKFPDPDYEGYEIVVPTEVVKDIILEYLRKTYYWSVGLFSLIIGILLGIII